MGCNCKSQIKEEKPKIIQVNGQMEMLEKPTYSIDEVDRVIKWLDSTNKTPNETAWCLNFNFQHFGEQLSGYCDLPCQARIRTRMAHLREKHRKYYAESTS